jgi:hypothetical protein
MFTSSAPAHQKAKFIVYTLKPNPVSTGKLWRMRIT